MTHKLKLSTAFILYIFLTVLNAQSLEKPQFGVIRVPLRGNAVDLHFINFTESQIEATPNFNLTSDEFTNPSLRNLIFIPNQTINEKKSFPIDIKLGPMQKYFKNNNIGIIARKFIQGILIYNNPLTYPEYVYNQKADFTSYSSFMWTNGTRTQKDGKYSFKNSINELNKFYYDVKIPLKNGSEILYFKLKFCAESNLDVTSKIFRSAPGYVQDFNNIAAILNVVSGILSIPSNPAAGIVSMLAGVAWTISGTGWMMDTDFNYTQLNLYNHGLSWLSSPFDLNVYPEDYKVCDKNGKVIAIPELDRERCALTYFLGTNSVPQSIIVQIAASTKGDIYIYAISKNILMNTKIKSLLNKNKQYLKEPGQNVIEQKK